MMGAVKTGITLKNAGDVIKVRDGFIKGPVSASATTEDIRRP